MAVDIKPGSKVGIEVKKSPTNEAAAKTLSRIFAKNLNDRGARRRRKELLRSAMQPTRRGGRIWMVRSKAPRLFQPTAGEACTVLATTDVIADLQSVERFIDVKPA